MALTQIADIPKKYQNKKMEEKKMYYPITAAPFRHDETYMEFEPCDALKPYIRCYWGTKFPVRQCKPDAPKAEIVTPDTCMDIMFSVDFTENKISNTFCGIDDRTFTAQNERRDGKTFFSFAIRFYAWGASAFSEESMCGVKNAFFDAGYHFPKIKKEIEPLLFEVNNACQLIPLVEQILLKYYNEKHKNDTVMEAVHSILGHRGNLSMNGLNKQLHISDRQMQRLFKEYVGVSPKSLASMVRYQYLWNDIIKNKSFNIFDAVYQYGYSDEAHLLHDFKKYHAMNIADAKKYAFERSTL